MSSSDVRDLASEQLARRLQAEEDELAAYQLQHQFNHHHPRQQQQGPLTLPPRLGRDPALPHRLGRVPVVTYNISPGSPGPVQYVIPDEELDDDVRELSFVQLSDDESMDTDIPMSPETNQLVSSALNTAFSSPNVSSAASTASDEVVILDDSVVEDSRPARRERETNSRDEDDNLVLTVGRSTRSQTRRLSSTDSSIVITNNSQAPSANTRSSTRNNNNTAGGSRPQNNRTDSAPPQQNNARQSRGSHSRPNSQPQSSSSSSSRNVNNTADNQPSTSSGRRGRPRGRNPRSRHRAPPLSVSSRVIINGVPIRGAYPGTDLDLFDHFQHITNILPTAGLFWRGNDSMTYEEMIALDDTNTLEPGQGLSKLDISQNTVTKPFNKAECAEDKTSCNICLCEFDEGEKVRTLPCFHSFHSTCIDNWLSRKAECPVCRSKIGENH